ncbi:hypothetical protein [Schlesneria paludicola]|uniref:hypothetical protein n=1 Tax=Schlesneria paludicola TaxID=360056 RepID=UPI00029B4D1C|nr:hypothetical protein [Schlesneria paludicola]
MFQRLQFAIVWMISGGCMLQGLQGMAADDPGLIRAGAHAQEITPPRFPISVNGGMADHFATAAHDPLYARCIAIRNAKTSIAIVVCDSCMIPREAMDRAKSLASTKTGIPTSRILISATHAHSCPTSAAVFQSDPDREYVEFLIEQIAMGVERAHNQAEPARIGWGSVEQPSLLFNRRWFVQSDTNPIEMMENPFGMKSDRIITNPGFNNPKVASSINQIDPELSFLSIQARDGRPIALLANYSLHYIGGVPGDLVSADYFGEFCQRVTRQLKAGDVTPPFVAALSNGTSGDVNNVDFRLKNAPQRQPFEQIAYAAELLAQDIAKAYPQIEYQATPPLKIREEEIVVGIRKPNAAELAAAEEKLAANTVRPLQGLPLIYARETTLLAAYPDSVSIKLQAIRIGSLGIVTCPCETFTETGLAIKKSSPLKQTFTISLANGYNGYLPPPEQHLLGGYETWRARSSYLAPDAEPKIQTTIKRLLNEVSR